MSLSFLLKKKIWKINESKDEKLYNKLLFLIYNFKILKGTIWMIFNNENQLKFKLNCFIFIFLKSIF